MSDYPERKTADVHSYTGQPQDGADSNHAGFLHDAESKSGFHTTTSTGFLSAPLSGPVRPLSPDTLSQLSVDEYEQLQPRTATNHIQVDPQGEFLPPQFQHGWRGKVQGFWYRNRGIIYMLIGQLFGTAMNVTVRFLEVEGNHGKGMHPYQILFARMSITLAIASGYMWWKQTPHFPFGLKEVRWLLVARGFGGFFGVFGMYFSLLYLPLADATVITFLAPGLACWACSILIHEPFTRREQVAGLVSLLGVVLIARPMALFGASSSGNAPPASGDSDVAPVGNGTAVPDAGNYESVTSSQRLLAVGVALLGVLGAATAYTTIRWIGRRAHPLLSVNYFAAWCTIVSVVMQFALPDVGFILPASLKEWCYLVFLGVCGFIMQFLLAAALSYEKSSRATNMIYCQMLFALASDKIFFGHVPGWMSILGSSLIVGSAVVVAVQQNVGQQSAAKELAVRGGNEGMPMVALDDEQHSVLLPRREMDEESTTGLVAGTQRLNTGEDHEREHSPHT